MTPTQTMVGLGEVQVIQGDAQFGCVGLGSCVAVLVADAEAQVAGVANVMLPKASPQAPGDRPAKYADTGVPHLVEMLERLGGERSRMKACLVGGAQVMHGQSPHLMLDFGARNAQAARQSLEAIAIPVIADDLGGDQGRTLFFDTQNGNVTVRTPLSPEKLLCQLR
jgi:chemotaxis protein CheD